MIDWEIVKAVAPFINTLAVVWLAISNRKHITKDALDTRLGGLSDRLIVLEQASPAHTDLKNNHAGLNVKVSDHGERIAALEQGIRHAPTHDDLKRIHTRLDDFSEGLSNLVGEFKQSGHTLNLIHEYLLKERRP